MGEFLLTSNAGSQRVERLQHNFYIQRPGRSTPKMFLVLWMKFTIPMMLPFLYVAKSWSSKTKVEVDLISRFYCTSTPAVEEEEEEGGGKGGVEEATPAASATTVTENAPLRKNKSKKEGEKRSF